MNVILKTLLICATLQSLAHNAQPMAQPGERPTSTTSPQSPISGNITSTPKDGKVFHCIAGTDFAAFVDAKIIHLKIGTTPGKNKHPEKEFRISHTKYSHGVAVTLTFNSSTSKTQHFNLACNLSGNIIDQLIVAEQTYKKKTPAALCEELQDNPELYWLIALLRLLPNITYDAFAWPQLKTHLSRQCFPTHDRDDGKMRTSKTPFKYELWDGLFHGAAEKNDNHPVIMFLTLADPDLITDNLIMGELTVLLPPHDGMRERSCVVPLVKHQTEAAATARPTAEHRTFLQQNNVNELLVAEFIDAALDLLEEERYCFDESETDDSGESDGESDEDGDDE